MLSTRHIILSAAVLTLIGCNSSQRNQGNQQLAGKVGSAHSGGATADELKAAAAKAGVRYLSQYPPLNGTNTYTVPPEEAKMYISTLSLPAGFTLKVDPKTPPIEWTVGDVQVAQGTTFDLSGSLTKPATPPQPAAKAQKTDKCQDGDAGSRGTTGVSGQPGKQLTMHVVNSISNSGALWIKTDGGTGGDGGQGQDGQQGGGPRNHIIVDQCSAGNGGPPGQGGYPGKGGPVAKVVITLGNSPTPFSNAVAPPPACAPSNRPSGTQGQTGVIQIYGAPGCDGKLGAPGQRGKNG